MPYLTPLPDRAWLAFTGPDARRFLHDQLTAPVADLDDERWQAAAYCNPQGRVLALLRVLSSEHGLLAELPAELAGGFCTRLKQFVFRSQVSIELLRDYGSLACWGESAPEVLIESGLQVPASSMPRKRNADLDVVSLPGTAPRFMLCGPQNVLGNWTNKFLKGFDTGTANDWTLQEIEAGWPEIYASTAGGFLPQSLGLEAWDALSFSKGCFPGQEIIARVRYRGQVKQHLYRAVIEGSAPVAGDPVLNNEKQTIGQVLYSATQYDHAHALVVLRSNEPCALAGGQQLQRLEKVFS